MLWINKDYLHIKQIRARPGYLPSPHMAWKLQRGRRLVAGRPNHSSMLAVDLHLLAYAALPLEPRSRVLGDM
jgi:hypothetical protein